MSQFPYIEINSKIISDFRCNDSPDFEKTSKLGREVYNFLVEVGVYETTIEIFSVGYHHVVWHCITTYKNEALVKAKLITILTSSRMALNIRPLFSGNNHNLNEIR